MSHVLKKAGIAALMLTGLATAATVGLGLVLRYQPASLMKPARRFAGRVLNPPVMWYTNRFGRKSQPLVYHRGRTDNYRDGASSNQVVASENIAGTSRARVGDRRGRQSLVGFLPACFPQDGSKDTDDQ